MEVPEIKRLQSVLLIKSKIVNYHTSRLTAPGENYGSTMLTVDIQLENGPLQVVAKMLPPNAFLQEMFKTHITFLNEIEFYRTIVPTLQAFQRDNKQEILDCFPKYYGGRINLNYSNKVDENAVLLLENLKVSGFCTVDRTVGFDYDTACLVLTDLAKFHATCVGLKIKRPYEFQAKIKPFLQEFDTFKFSSNDFKPKFINYVLDVIKEDSSLVNKTYKIKEILSNQLFVSNTKNSAVRQREPFSTIIHTDFWVNNTMVKFVDNKPVKNKMVDFQLYEYGSAVRDVIFFLYSSVQIGVIEECFDNLVEIYYSTFIKSLKELRCDIKEFSFSKFEEEMKIEAIGYEFLHCLVMLKPIFATQENIKELHEFNEEMMLEDSVVTQKEKEKMIFIIKEFFKRNWLT